MQFLNLIVDYLKRNRDAFLLTSIENSATLDQEDYDNKIHYAQKYVSMLSILCSNYEVLLLQVIFFALTLSIE